MAMPVFVPTTIKGSTVKLVRNMFFALKIQDIQYLLQQLKCTIKAKHCLRLEAICRKLSPRAKPSYCVIFLKTQVCHELYI